MSQKRTETLIYSTVGVVAMLLIVVALNFIFSLTNAHVDLTEENLYTLSPGTRDILNSLDTDIEVRLYATQDAKIMPVRLRDYARRVESLLREYAQYAHGHLVVRKLDPEPDSDAEDNARLDGIEGQTVSVGEQVYLGVAFSEVDRTSALPFLAPDREPLLEYDLSRAITQVSKAEKAVVGVMSSLPVMGTEMNPMMMRMGQQGQQPWVLITELKRDFDVKEVPMTTDKIDDDIDVLLVIHPKQITDGAQYAIDQFLMRGGKLIALLDPMALVDNSQPASNQMMGPPPSTSNLDKLLKAWGLSFETSKVVADMNYAKQLSFQRGRPAELNPVFLFLNDKAINKKDVSTAEIDEVLLAMAGTFSGTPVEGLKETELLSTSDNSQLVDGFMARMAPSQIVKEFASGGKSMPLALRLTGTFKTAFPDGKPGEAGKTNAAPAAGGTLKESKTNTVVALVGDADFVNDAFSVRQVFPGIYSYVNGNLSLIQSLVEQLAGDSRLIDARSRATMNRPFTRIRAMQQVAEGEYRKKIQDLEKEQQDVQTKISQLQTKKEDGQRFVLSTEQQEELAKFQQKLVDTNKALKKLRRTLNKDIDSMENRLKLVNIAGMPFLVIVVGVVSAIMKRKRTAAK